VALLLGVCFAGAPAGAQEGGDADNDSAALPAKVEDLIREGVKLRKEGRDNLALPVFQRAYDLVRTPRTAAQLGLAEASLGYWLSAEEHLSEALAAPGHPWVNQYRKTLEETLADVRAHIGELAVTGTPVGAKLEVNGKPQGTLPLEKPIRLAEGRVRVRVQAPGFSDSTQSLRIEARKVSELQVDLEKTPLDTASAPGIPAPTLGSSEPAGDSYAVRDLPRRPWLKPLGWVAAGSAALAVGVGTYGLLEQRARSDDFHSYALPGTTTAACGEKAPNRGGGICKDLYEDVQSAGRLAVFGFVAGGVLAAAAVTAFVLDRDPAEEPYALSPLLTPGLWGVALSASY